MQLIIISKMKSMCRNIEKMFGYVDHVPDLLSVSDGVHHVTDSPSVSDGVHHVIDLPSVSGDVYHVTDLLSVSFM